MNNFDSIVMGAMSVAQAYALERKNPELTPEHLLYGLINNPQSYSSKKLKEFEKDLKKSLDNLPTVAKLGSIENLKASAKLGEWLTKASSRSIQAGRQDIREDDLLRFLPDFFPNYSINWEDFNKEEDHEEQPEFLVNLNELAANAKLDPVIGRTQEIRAVMEILGRRGKNNPVLVGPAGVGKTAIAEGLAEAIYKKEVPDVLLEKTIYSLDLGALMAGTKFRGEFEERMQKLLKFIKQTAGESILFIDEIHQLVGAGKTEGAMDAANLLKPALARGELACIGATTHDEYQKYILGDAALDRRFRPVTVDEPSIEDSVEILMGVREKLEIHHGIKISDDAVYNAVVLSDQYITDKNLPDKAIDLIDEASSAMKLSAEAMPRELVELEAEIRSKKIYSQIEKNDNKAKKEILELEKKFSEGKEVWEKEILSMKKVSELKNRLDRYRFDLDQAEREQNYEDASKLKYSLIPEVEKEIENCSHDWVLGVKQVAEIISRQTGIPQTKILKDKQEQILELENYLQQEVLGQTEPLHEISETLIAAHAGLSDPTKPLGSFLLKGPSGVGKTETAKAISRFLFNSENNLIRLDLSEFSEKHSVSKLIGAPAGYVGYDEGGVLTEAIRRKPYSVILFDEVEKAHPDFADILLQILDDGRLTDNKGRTVNFKNTVILLTSNSKNLELDFKPEVLGRLDGVLSYQSLDESIMEGLIEREVTKLNERLATKKLYVNLTAELKNILAKRGYDERYGARPLASVFNKLVTRPLSKKLLKGELKEGELELGLEGNSLVIA